MWQVKQQINTDMTPLIITGTCKELYNCEKLLRRFGYIPEDCNLKTADNHESGFIVINREGEFSFHKVNPHPDYPRLITACDFMKNYGLLGIRTVYTFSNIYTVVTICLFLTGIEGSTWAGRLVLLALLLVNIPLHWKSIRKLN